MDPLAAPAGAPSPRDRLVAGFTPGERERILAAGAARALRRGEVVFREGEPAAAFYLLEAGRLKLTQATAGGEEVILRYLAPGDAFAAVALFDAGTYPVTARATERSRVRAWPREVLRPIAREHPRFESNLLGIVSSHMRDTLSRVRELATEPVPQRLARTLLRLAGQVGRREAGGTVSIERITQQELAEIAGTTPYTVSRILADWQHAGLVETARQRVRLRDLERLAALAEGR